MTAEKHLFILLLDIHSAEIVSATALDKSPHLWLLAGVEYHAVRLAKGNDAYQMSCVGTPRNVSCFPAVACWVSQSQSCIASSIILPKHKLSSKSTESAHQWEVMAIDTDSTADAILEPVCTPAHVKG